MPAKPKKIATRSKPTREGEAMNAAFKKATARARLGAFEVRKTIMIEKDGWLVMVNKAGRVVRRVKRIEPLNT